MGHDTPSLFSDATDTAPLKAATYIRMSTEHQQYSTENQMDSIREHAERRQMEIVRIYSDEGKSGLGIQWRGALQQLIADVQAGNCGYDVTLVEMHQYPEDSPVAGEGLSLPIEQVIHLRWDAPPFSPRGNSLVLPAFQSIELLRDYRRAEQAIAKRWATPFRLIKVGGAYQQRVITPDQKMLQNIRDLVNKMDMKSGLVVPFYVTVETHGAEGSVLNVEEKVREVKEDIIVALGLSRSLVTGDGPNFATASVSMQKMLVMIRELKQVARQVLDWVVTDWLAISGHDKATVQYLFNDLDPSDAVEMKKLLLDLYDRKLISRSSLQMKMELDPEVEAANRSREQAGLDQLDATQIKPIADLVMLGVLDPEEARSFLGLGPKPATPEAAAAKALGGPAARAYAEEALCDECRHFAEADNRCAVQQAETTFDARACRFFDSTVMRSF